MRDPAMARDVVAYIRDHEEQWDQEVWARQLTCGTTACFAGWTAILDGWKPVFWPGENPLASFFEKDGRQEAPDVVAAELLGLTDFEKEYLFYCPANIDELADRVDWLAERKFDSTLDLAELMANIEEVFGPQTRDLRPCRNS